MLIKPEYKLLKGIIIVPEILKDFGKTFRKIENY